jgi:choline/glycine/proline betaine transport protein
MPDAAQGLRSKQPAKKLGPVFVASAVLIAAIVLLGAVAPQAVGLLFTAAQAWIMSNLGGFYLLAVAGFFFFVIFLAVSSYGTIRLGPNHSEPDFSYGSWFAMLFSAGMGIGLVFFGVAEPILHFTTPPVGEGGTVDAARAAMRITFFHWGVHA